MEEFCGEMVGMTFSPIDVFIVYAMRQWISLTCISLLFNLLFSIHYVKTWSWPLASVRHSPSVFPILLRRRCSCLLSGAKFKAPRNVRLTFVRNRGELAEGWYDPATLQKAVRSAEETKTYIRNPGRRRGSPDYGPGPEDEDYTAESSGDDDDIGPALPNANPRTDKRHRSGPAIPSLQDLELRRGMSNAF